MIASCKLMRWFAVKKQICYFKTMTLHKMNLQDRYFDYIQHGTKRIELRLNDEKRRLIQLSDQIEFTNSRSETLLTEVIGLLKYQSFDQLCADLPIELLADASMTKDELLQVLGEFYSTEQQQEYGVLGIRLKLSSEWKNATSTYEVTLVKKVLTGATTIFVNSDIR